MIASIAIALLILLVSSNEAAVFALIHRSVAAELIDASLSVFDGRPPWRAFQNRLLGPYLLSLFEHGTQAMFAASPAVARLFERIYAEPGMPRLALFNAFTFFTLLLKNTVVFFLLLRFTRRASQALLHTALAAICFVALADKWFYAWDFFDLIFFYGFAYFIFARGTVGPGLFLLFAATLANRKSAAFFGLWFVGLATARRLLGDRPDWAGLALGLGLILVALGYATLLRQALFVKSPLSGLDAQHRVLGNHVSLPLNLVLIARNVVTPEVYLNLLLVLMAAHGAGLVWLGRARRDAHVLAIGLFVLALLAAILVLALIDEPRVFLIYTPMLVFSVAAFRPQLRRLAEALDGAGQARDRRLSSSLAVPAPVRRYSSRSDWD